MPVPLEAAKIIAATGASGALASALSDSQKLETYAPSRPASATRQITDKHTLAVFLIAAAPAVAEPLATASIRPGRPIPD
jgi:hypothetical protein